MQSAREKRYCKRLELSRNQHDTPKRTKALCYIFHEYKFIKSSEGVFVRTPSADYDEVAHTSLSEDGSTPLPRRDDSWDDSIFAWSSSPQVKHHSEAIGLESPPSCEDVPKSGRTTASSPTLTRERQIESILQKMIAHEQSLNDGGEGIDAFAFGAEVPEGIDDIVFEGEGCITLPQPIDENCESYSGSTATFVRRHKNSPLYRYVLQSFNDRQPTDLHRWVSHEITAVSRQVSKLFTAEEVKERYIEIVQYEEFATHRSTLPVCSATVSLTTARRKVAETVMRHVWAVERNHWIDVAIEEWSLAESVIHSALRCFTSASLPHNTILGGEAECGGGVTSQLSSSHTSPCDDGCLLGDGWYVGLSCRDDEVMMMRSERRKRTEVQSEAVRILCDGHSHTTENEEYHTERESESEIESERESESEREGDVRSDGGNERDGPCSVVVPPELLDTDEVMSNLAAVRRRLDSLHRHREADGVRASNLKREVQRGKGTYRISVDGETLTRSELAQRVRQQFPSLPRGVRFEVAKSRFHSYSVWKNGRWLMEHCFPVAKYGVEGAHRMALDAVAEYRAAGW